MAKASWQDSYNNPPSWARDLREKRLREEEAAAARRAAAENDNAKYNAQVDAIQEDAGVIFDDNTRRSMIESLRSGRPLRVDTTQEDTPAQPVLPAQAKPSFTDVESNVVSTEEGTFADTARTMGATLRDSLKGMGARFLDQSERLPNVGSTYNVLELLTGVDPRQVPRGIAADLRKEANDPARVARTEQLSARYEQQGGVTGFVGAGAVDALQSPSSVLSLVGGPVGAAAIADAYASAYEQGAAEGLSGENLEAWALTQSAPELVSLVPAGKVVTKIPVIGPMIQDRLAKVAARQTAGVLEKKVANPILAGAIRTAQTAVGETAGEVTTGTLQDLASSAFAGQSQAADLQRIGQKAMPQDAEGNFSISEFLSRRGKEARAAIVTAGAAAPINQGTAYRDYRKQRGEQDDRRVNDILAADAASLQKPAEAPAQRPITEPTQPDMFGTPADLPTVEEYDAARQKTLEEDAAWAARSRERQQEQPQATRQARRDELRTSIQNRVDTARQDVEVLQDRIENGDVDSATLNTAAAANARLREAETALRNFDESFAAPQQPAATAPVTTPARAEEAAPVQGDLLEGVRATELSAASDKIKTAKERQQARAAKEAAAAKAAETARQNRLAAQVVKEHGDKTEAEQAQILADLVANPEAKAIAAPKEKTAEEKIQGVINQVEGMRKRRSTQRVSNRIRNLYRQDPTRTAKDIADILAQEEGTVQTTDTAPDEATLREQIANMKRKPGSLSMDEVPAAATLNEREASLDAGAAPAVRTPEKQAAFEAKVRELVSGMANTKEDVAIHNLIKQGKLIITDNPASVGRDTKGSAAEFVPATGKMYLYADSAADGSQAKAALLRAAAAHEGGHAGSFSPREGRGGIMQYIMGERGNAEANTLIRKLADQGNVTAKKAVALAKRAAEVNKGFSNVEDLELTPYVLSELRGQSPGRLGKIVRDAKAGARKLGRSVGMDIDFTLDDIAIAAEQVAGELVKTDTLKPTTQTDGNLDMIYSEGSANFNAPENQARMYTSVDGKRKYVLSDKDSKLKDGAGFMLFEAANNNTPVTLGDIFDHSVLYKEHPDAKNIEVDVLPDNQMNGYGHYDPETGKITVSQSLVQGKGVSLDLREGLLHEIQHWVQDKTDRASTFYDARDVNYSPATQQMIAVSETAGAKRAREARKILDNVKELTSNAIRQEKEELAKKILFNRDMTNEQKVNGIRSYLENNAIALTPKAQAIFDTWADVQREFSAAVTNRNDAIAEENITSYVANLNEAESFRTQFDRDLAQEELDARGNPEQQMRDEYRSRTGGRLDVPQGDGRVVSRGQSLGMSEEAAARTAGNPKFSLNERINRILSHGRQERLETVKIAEDLHTQMVDAIHKDTGGKVLFNGTRFETHLGDTKLSNQMNKDFTEFLSHPDQGTVEGRARLISEMKAKYPETTKVLLEARDRISDMTVDIIDDMLSTGRPLSVTQRKQIATMVANKDIYLSRAFAAFQQEKGRKWAKGRWANFVKNADTALDSITDPKVKADVKAVRDAITVIQKSLHIPDTEVMQDLPMSSLEALAVRHDIKDSQLQFDRNDPDASFLKRDEIISKLEKIKEAFPEAKLYDMALRDAKDLMGLGNRDSAYAKQMSDMVKNPGTLKERQRVPLEIRRMLGEIELAPGVLVATMANQASLRARAKVISELINDPQNDIAISKEDFFNLPDGVTSDNSTLLEVAANAAKPRAARTKADYREVNGEEWGALNGMYLHKKAYSRMEEATGLMYTWSDALSKMSHDINPLTGKIVRGLGSTLGSLNRWNKLTTVVYNPISWVGNFSGSFLNMVGAGNFSPTALKEGMGTAREYVEGTFNTTTTPRLSKVIRYMNLEAADIAEMQRVLGGTLEKYFRSPESFQNGEALLNKHASGLAGRTHKSVIAGYAIMDNWSKIANFYHRYEVLRSMYDAAGVKKTEDQILQEAGDDTSYTNISPERVHDVIRAAESAGVSQYAPYFAEVLRTRATNLALAHKDFKRGRQLAADGKQEAANIMYKTAALRLAGQAIANVGMPMVGAFKISARLAALGVPAAAASAIVNGLSALGGDEEDNEKKRRLISEMNRVQDLTMVGKNKDGFPTYYAYSQKLDPNGPFTDLIRAFVYAEDYEDVYKNLQASSLYIFPQILKDTWNAMAGENFPESDVGRIWPQLKQTLVDAGISANDADRYLNVADNVIPGVARAWKTQNTVEGVEADPETKRFLETMNLLGARFETFDPRRTLKSYAGDSKDAKAENNGALNRSLINVPRPTEKSILDATGEFYKRELERQVKDYRNTVDSLRGGWKFSEEDTAALLEQGGFPKKDIPDMLEGVASVKLSLKSFLDYADKSGGYQDSREYEKRREKAVEIASMIIEMKPQLEELGIEVDTTGIPKEWKE